MRIAIVHQSWSRPLIGAALVACLLAIPLCAARIVRDDGAIAAILPGPQRLPTASEQGFVAAEIYFVPWDVRTAVGISLERTRDPVLRKEVVHDWRRLDDLWRRLQPESLHAGSTPPSLLGDYRLLVVFIRDDGREVSYAADFNQLVNPATLAYRPIGADFRAALSPGKW